MLNFHFNYDYRVGSYPTCIEIGARSHPLVGGPYMGSIYVGPYVQ